MLLHVGQVGLGPTQGMVGFTVHRVYRVGLGFPPTIHNYSIVSPITPDPPSMVYGLRFWGLPVRGLGFRV